jgi:hypothetical protein
MRSVVRAGRVNMFAVAMLVVFAAGALLVERFGPYYWDYWKMKEVTKTAALHWKVFSRKAAEEKLRSMLDDKEISEYIEPSYCIFEDGLKRGTVYCSWEVDVFYPFSDSYRTLDFHTEHTVQMDGV